MIEHHGLSRYGIGVETTHKALFEKDGKLWFGSMDGLIVLDPSQIRSDNHISQVHIIDFYLDGSEPDWIELGHELKYETGKKKLPNLSFPNRSSSYTFHFTGLDFSNPKNVEYRYRLEGLESQWNLPTKNRNTIYTNLSMGSYRFDLQARSGQGPWSEAAFYECPARKRIKNQDYFLIFICKPARSHLPGMGAPKIS